MYSRLFNTRRCAQLKIEPLQVIEFLCARMVELVDTRDLKSRGPGRVRAGSSPAPGTNNLCLPELCGSMDVAPAHLVVRIKVNATRGFIRCF
jgi:hypothetical protein